jgi:hypothetical protein
VIATYLAIAVSAWGTPACGTVSVEWHTNLVVGQAPIGSVYGYAPGTNLKGVASPSRCVIQLNLTRWRRTHPRYQCDLVTHEVGHLRLMTGRHDHPALRDGWKFASCTRWWRSVR